MCRSTFVYHLVTVTTVVVVVFAAIVAATEGHPNNDRKLHQDEVQTVPPHDRQTNVNDVQKNSKGPDSNKLNSAKSRKKVPAPPQADDDLLEFLVRVADNPAEWNKIRRVLSMLGHDEAGTTVGAGDDSGVATVVAVTAAVTKETMDEKPSVPGTPLPVTIGTAEPDHEHDDEDCDHHLHQQRVRGPATLQPRGILRAPPTTPVASKAPAASRASWPSSDWIRETAEKLEEAAANHGDGTGGGGAGYDEDDEDVMMYDDDETFGDELEVLDGTPDLLPLAAVPARPRGGSQPCPIVLRMMDGGCADDGGAVGGAYVAVVESATAAAAANDRRTAARAIERPHSPPPLPPRSAAGGHMSRYQFKRIDGGPDDGRINGTYVAVVESDRPPR